MKILHTSDWHLGRNLEKHDLKDEQRFALQEMFLIIESEKPDCVIISGDVFDRAQPSAEAVALLDETLARLVEDCKVQVIMIAGNHDNPERISYGKEIFRKRGLHVFDRAQPDSEPLVLRDEYGPVYFVVFPFIENTVACADFGIDNTRELGGQEGAFKLYLTNITAKIPAGARTVAVAHAFVTGCAGSESEREIYVGGSIEVSADVFSNFNYTALGHLHRPQLVGGKHNIRYSGSLYKYSTGENHDKGVVIVEIDAAGNVDTAFLHLKMLRNVVRLTGKFEDMVASDGIILDDYCEILLTDSGIISDVYARLFKHYPHLIRVQFTERQRLAGDSMDVADGRSISPRTLFEQYWRGEKLRELNAQEIAVVEKMFAEIESGWKAE